jgi:CheY-like chemotaxis protein
MATVVSEIPGRSPRALVVDDSQIARYMLSGQLADLGFKVDLADSAESALARLERGLPDVVFMDHLLPGIDGLEAVRRLRGKTRTASLPIIMYTSQDGEGYVDRARDAGANDIYTKTSDEIRLAVILRRLDLLPKAVNEQAASSSVTAINRPHRPTAVPASGSVKRKKITKTDLAKLLEPSLETHHAKLRKELLAEFAILENYEERMRHDLFARMDVLMCHTTDQIQQAFGKDREARQTRRGSDRVRGLGLAAMVLVCFGLSFAMNWNMSSKLEQSITEQETAYRMFEISAQTQSALRKELADAWTMAASSDAAVIEYANSQPADALLPDTQPETGVATALVNELQSMGILGPVRVETSAGSFCVTATASGYRIEGANVALKDCESLPVQMSMSKF